MKLLFLWGCLIMIEYILVSALGASSPARTMVLGFANGVLALWLGAQVASRRYRFL